MAKPIRKNTWSNLDVFGLLNGLAVWDKQYKNLKYIRKPYESNLDIRDRIYDAHKNPGGISKQGILNGISNEFSLDPYNVIDKKVFQLSYTPIPSGGYDVHDISGFFKDSNNEWKVIGPQIWGENYTSSKESKTGFIVWQNSRFSTISGYKNFSYSNIVEIFRELDDNTELKFIYYVEGVDPENNKILMQYTDMNNPLDSNDTRFTYKKSLSNEASLSSDAIVYTLNDIPSEIKNNTYYDSKTGMGKEFLYDLKKYIDKKFNHTWDKITNKSCIWDIHKSYGSGHIPSFYDAIVPYNFDQCNIQYSGYIGGIESLSYALYPSTLIESGTNGSWYFKVFPGKFYIDGISFYYLENPTINNLNFTPILSGALSGLYESALPSNLTRHKHTILAKSGYYDEYCNSDRDEYLSGVYEDYSYYTGIDGDKMWSNILEKVPYLTNQMGYDYDLSIGKYCLDYASNKIYCNIPSEYTELTLIWDNTLVPSGSYLLYDVNPLNDQNLSFDKFFIYLSLESNRR